ncbi:MAG: hypothetical protein Q9225_005064 [Loekoesia sp. 1 TL-2023]
MVRAGQPPADHDISHLFEPVGNRNIGAAGAFNAGVFIVRGRKTGKKYVEKKFSQEDIMKGAAGFEMFVMRELRHKNIVKYIGAFIDVYTHPTPIGSMYLEYCDKGNLLDYVQKRHRSGRMFGEAWIWDSFIQLVDAVAFMQLGIRNACHKREKPGHWIGVVHRDIKLDNIFLCSRPDSGKLRLVLGDFGQAIREDDDGNWGRHYLGGNRQTAPPEVLRGGTSQYSFKGDVWALGCCISEICQPLVPPVRREYAGPYYSESLSKAIAYLMRMDPHDRPNMDAFARHMLRWRRDGLMSGQQPHPF